MDDLEILEYIVAVKPKSGLSRLRELLGPGPAVKVMKELSGQVLYIPTTRKIFLMSLPLVIEQHTRGLSGREKHAAYKRLSLIYRIPTWLLKKRYKNRIRT